VFAGMKVSVTHDLKIVEPFYSDVAMGVKRFELRKNDRNFAVGDFLVLRKWSLQGGYTGDLVRCTVVYILEGGRFGLEPGYSILGIELWHDNELHLPPPG
jgi:hypothetical protein